MHPLDVGWLVDRVGSNQIGRAASTFKRKSKRRRIEWVVVKHKLMYTHSFGLPKGPSLIRPASLFSLASAGPNLAGESRRGLLSLVVQASLPAFYLFLASLMPCVCV